MHIVGFQMRYHRVSETLACYLKYLVDCSIVQVNRLRLRVPESSWKLGLLLRVSRRHVARQSSHISGTLVFLKCLSAMCTKMVSKKYRSTSFLRVLACYLKYLVDCSIVQVNQLCLRVPESSQKLGLLLRVSRRHVVRQSSRTHK